LYRYAAAEADPAAFYEPRETPSAAAGGGGGGGGTGQKSEDKSPSSQPFKGDFEAMKRLQRTGHTRNLVDAAVI
jgi:hypothetical protein